MKMVEPTRNIASDYSNGLENLSHLRNAIDLKGKGKLHQYNVTSKGLEEKGNFSKIWAIISNFFGFSTDLDRLKEATNTYLDEGFKKRFSKEINKSPTLTASITNISQILIKIQDPSSELSLFANSNMFENESLKLQSNALDTIDNVQKRDVFNNLQPKTKAALFGLFTNKSEPPILQPHTLDTIGIALETIDRGYQKKTFFNNLKPETRAALMDRNPNYIEIEENSHEIIKFLKPETLDTLQKRKADQKIILKKTPNLEDLQRLYVAPQSAKNLIDMKDEGTEKKVDSAGIRGLPKEPKKSESIELIGIEEKPEIEIPLQYYKDIINRANIQVKITLGNETYEINYLKQGAEQGVENAIKFIEKSKEWVEREFANLTSDEQKAIHLSILQNITQGIFTVSLNVGMSEENLGKKRNLLNIQGLGFESRSSLECSWKKSEDNALLFSGKTILNYYTPDESDKSQFTEFYRETYDFETKITGFNINYQLHGTQKTLLPAWQEQYLKQDITMQKSENFQTIWDELPEPL